MSKSIDKLIDGMPYPTLTKITGTPGYDPIKTINNELTANAYSVQTNLGCGTVGYARLTLTPGVYATISIAAWIPPLNPGLQPVIPVGSTGIQISALNRAFDTASEVYSDFQLVGNALKRQLLAAVDDIFLCSLKQPYIGYGNVTVLALLTHLYSTYAQISPGDLEINNENMTRDYDPNLPIETLFKQVEDSVAYADHGGAPISTVQTTNRAFTLVFRTGIFVDDCREWKRLPLDQKTWINFKVEFAQAHQEWRESNSTTAGAHFGVNNLELQNSTANAIAELSAATAADRATMVSLTASVQTLTAQLASTQTLLASTQAQLVKAVAMNPGEGTRERGGRQRKPNPYGPNRHYCWACGFDCAHASSDHPNKAAGHKDQVNRFNTKGSSQANKK